jgi:hypothetical protein
VGEIPYRHASVARALALIGGGLLAAIMGWSGATTSALAVLAVEVVFSVLYLTLKRSDRLPASWRDDAPPPPLPNEAVIPRLRRERRERRATSAGKP